MKDNFVSRLENKRNAWRYGCSRPGCTNLEDMKKFSNCGGCVVVKPRKYCSVECQRLDWGEHKKDCKPPKTPTPAYKKQDKPKKKGNKNNF